MDIDNLIESFSEFKEVKNINRETMMNILEDVFKSVLAKKYDEADIERRRAQKREYMRKKRLQDPNYCKWK